MKKKWKIHGKLINWKCFVISVFVVFLLWERKTYKLIKRLNQKQKRNIYVLILNWWEEEGEQSHENNGKLYKV